LLTTEVYVKSPQYQAIQVEVRLAANPYAAFDAVAQQVEQALNRFLNPFQWTFGQELYPTSLYNTILDVTEVREVLNLAVFVDGRPHEDLRQPVILPPDGLLYGKGHLIRVVPYQDI
jgi:hypothetical protein